MTLQEFAEWARQEARTHARERHFFVRFDKDLGWMLRPARSFRGCKFPPDSEALSVIRRHWDKKEERPLSEICEAFDPTLAAEVRTLTRERKEADNREYVARQIKVLRCHLGNALSDCPSDIDAPLWSRILCSIDRAEEEHAQRNEPQAASAPTS